MSGLRIDNLHIVVARTDNLGDFITSLPAAEILKGHKAGRVTYLGKEKFGEIIKGYGHIDDYISVDGEESMEKFRGLKADVLINMVNTPNVIPFLKAAHHIPTRIGSASKIRFLRHFTHRIVQHRSKSIKSETAYNCDLLHPLIGSEFELPRTLLQVTEYEKSAFLERLSRYNIVWRRALIVHPGIAESTLNWRFENYLQLVIGALKSGATVFLTGNTPRERDQNAVIRNSVPERYVDHVIDMSLELELREFMVLCKLSGIYIGCSTGTTHLASACGCKIIGFYPPIAVNSPVRWAPHKYGGTIFVPNFDCPERYKCQGIKCPHYYCMDSISVESVLENLSPESGS